MDHSQTHVSFAPASPSVTATLSPERGDADPHLLRELRAIREIAHAFLLADRPSEVQQLALDRVTPLLGASFSLIMHLGDDGELLHPVAQHEWPVSHRNWIGALRVRVGDGPSGAALAEQRLVEVPDLFADPSLEAWYPVAEELGFRSIVAAPLIGHDGPVGAVAFYFSDPTSVDDAQRALVRLVADQLAATADKAAMIDTLRRTNAALADANEALEGEARRADAARHARDRFVSTLTRRVRESLDPVAAGDIPDDALGAPRDALAAARAVARAAEELASIECAERVPEIGDVDPREPLLAAVQEWRSERVALPVTLGEPTVLLPTMRSDAAWVRRILSLLLGQVLARHGGHDPVHVDVELGRGFVAHRMEWTGDPLPDLARGAIELAVAENDSDGAPGDSDRSPTAGHPRITALDLALAVAMVRRLGGDLYRDVPGETRTGDGGRAGVTVVFPVDDA